MLRWGLAVLFIHVLNVVDVVHVVAEAAQALRNFRLGISNVANDLDYQPADADEFTAHTKQQLALINTVV
jgi:hypothetical protein